MQKVLDNWTDFAYGLNQESSKMYDETVEISPTKLPGLREHLSSSAVSPGAIKSSAAIIATMMKEGLTAAQVAERFDMPFIDVIEILGDPTFLRHFSNIRKEAAKTEFNVKVHDRMSQIMSTGQDRDAVKAASVWADILGEKAIKTVKHSHEFEWVDETIKKLKDKGKIIDVEVEEIKK